MPRLHRVRPVAFILAALAMAATVLSPATPTASASPSSRPGAGIEWVELTITELRHALGTGRVTCTEVVQGYLDRIDEYDDELASVIEVSDTALEEAAALDELRPSASVNSNQPGVGPLHCVPLVIKDNIDVDGMPTTAGNTALTGMMPEDDAHVVEQLTDAGAIVIGKANLDEFAFGFGGESSLGGQVNNAYDLTRGPGGSSSGTGASVAASLAMAGLGTDTGGSVRVPSSVGGLVGIRPSMRLVSQDGVIPLALFQDTVGPMCRTVEDCALVLEALTGYDDAPTSGQHTLPQQRDDRAELLPSAEAYRETVGTRDGDYQRALRRSGLRNARIGVVRDLFGDDPEVNAVLDDAIAAMEAAGAEVEEVEIPDLDGITSFTSNSRYEFRDHLTAYLSARPDDGYPRSFEEMAEVTESRQSTFAFYGMTGADRYNNPDYDRNTLERPDYVRPRLMAALDNTDLDGNAQGEAYDALMYPSVRSLPRVGGAPSAGSNNRLSPFSGFPALTMPAGFAPATDEHPELPVGMELLGREFDEATLLQLAYGYQETVAGTDLARIAPPTTPEL